MENYDIKLEKFKLRDNPIESIDESETISINVGHIEEAMGNTTLLASDASEFFRKLKDAIIRQTQNSPAIPC